MTDLLPFGEEGFDVEKFINDACARKPENESMDRRASDSVPSSDIVGTWLASAAFK